ncbi:MAG: hypothetical protein KFB96_01040 [Thiocapsa sp.]|uniref:hypothetical protein n=1 Tax=Thiocapsa sp. TaxID=2024551 RepID=UPI001BCC7990|nr:hypothetical protein [Thiocapsa sp.]QVL49153.1 MAG: hypothetical protein KFB96_01040 [Thiocapsa sp.]
MITGHRHSVQMRGDTLVETRQVEKLDVRCPHQHRTGMAQDRRFLGVLLDDRQDGLAGAG